MTKIFQTNYDSFKKIKTEKKSLLYKIIKNPFVFVSKLTLMIAIDCYW